MHELEPTVSVIVPAYKASDTIERAVGSALKQRTTSVEVIVIDDASPDDTAQIVEGLCQRDDRVRLIRLEKNSRQSFARNTGIAEARGRWIAILDADDAFADHRLDVLVEHAERRGLDMVADNQLLFDVGLGAVVRAAMPTRGGARSWSLLAHCQNERLIVGHHVEAAALR
ncbi:MAG: glycosyltransferase family 2 protein, partial [Pseudomonadota bacterium]